tara:strand:+ start:93 stop:452 length:360 start_codon:yes stop_codon:yes gene_type:complete
LARIQPDLKLRPLTRKQREAVDLLVAGYRKGEVIAKLGIGKATFCRLAPVIDAEISPIASESASEVPQRRRKPCDQAASFPEDQSLAEQSVTFQSLGGESRWPSIPRGCRGESRWSSIP